MLMKNFWLSCYAERGDAMTPLIVNNNKYLARRSPSSLSQSYQCVNNTPTSSQMCLQQHLGFQDCQHSTNNSSALPYLVSLTEASWKKERKKEATRNRKWFRLPASPAHCRLLAAFICCKINKWSFLASHKQNIVWEQTVSHNNSLHQVSWGEAGPSQPLSGGFYIRITTYIVRPN